jgi:peptidyl-prolyl cis-trans isomerase D
MFDLFRRKDTVVRYILVGLLSLVALSMVITLVPGFGSGGAGNGEPDLASVGSWPSTEKVTMTQARQYLRGVIGQMNMPQSSIATFVPQLVENLVMRTAVQYQAGREGLQVNDKDVSSFVETNVPQLFDGDKFRGMEAYQNFLASRGTNVTQFEKEMREDMMSQRLRFFMSEAAAPTEAELKAEFRRQNEKLKVDYVLVDPREIETAYKPTEAEMRAQYDKTKGAFMTKEARRYTLVAVDGATVMANVPVPEEEIQRTYRESIDSFRIPDRVMARHILLSTTNKNEAEKGAIRAKIEGLLKQVKAGGNFADLAKKNSEDPGSKEKGGDLGWVTKGQMVPPFEAAVFSLQPGQISGVVTTEYGFHIVKAEAREVARLKPIEEVRDDIIQNARRSMGSQKLQDTADQLYRELAKSPKDANAIAAKFGAVVAGGAVSTPNDPLALIGMNQDIANAMIQSKAGQVTAARPSADGQRMVVAVVDEVIAARQGSFEEMAEQVRIVTVQAGTQKLLNERKALLAAKLKEGVTDLNALAAAVGTKVKTTATAFNREGAAEGLGPASAMAPAFDKNPGQLAGPFELDGKPFVVRVAEKTAADETAFAAQKTDMLNRVRGRRAGDREALFRASMMESLKASGAVKQNQAAVDALMASMR